MLHLVQESTNPPEKSHISLALNFIMARHLGTGALLDLPSSCLPPCEIQESLLLHFRMKDDGIFALPLGWLNLSCSSIGEIPFVCLAAHQPKFRRWRAWGDTTGTVKLLLPPRQSRGNSLGY